MLTVVKGVSPVCFSVCKFKAHKRCAVRATNNCKWTTLASIGKDIIEDEDGVSLCVKLFIFLEIHSVLKRHSCVAMHWVLHAVEVIKVIKTLEAKLSFVILCCINQLTSLD